MDAQVFVNVPVAFILTIAIDLAENIALCKSNGLTPEGSNTLQVVAQMFHNKTSNVNTKHLWSLLMSSSAHML